MNPPSMEPEFILEESAETNPMENGLKCSNPSWDQVVVELEQSLKACKLLVDLAGNIESQLQVLVRSLEDT